MPRARKFGLAGIALLFCLLALVWPEVPAWRQAGANSLPAASVALRKSPLGCPPANAVIALFGDSHVKGSRMTGNAPTGQKPYGKVLERTLGNGAKVTLNGVGGHTAQMGETRWLQSDQSADLVVIAYGTNDAAPRGFLRSKTAVPVTAFKASLARQITHWHAKSRQVILLAPPPGGSAAINRRLQPYREATREVGAQLNVAVLDPADALASCASAQPLLTHDALHLNPAGHQCLGTWMASQICPREPAAR